MSNLPSTLDALVNSVLQLLILSSKRLVIWSFIPGILRYSSYIGIVSFKFYRYIYVSCIIFEITRVPRLSIYQRTSRFWDMDTSFCSKYFFC